MNLRILECKGGLFIVTDRETGETLLRVHANTLEQALDRIDEEIAELDRDTIKIHDVH